MKALTLRLPDEVHEALRREAFESRRSMNDLVLEALSDRATVWDDGFLRGLIQASRINDNETLADWEYPTGNPYRDGSK